MSETTRIVAGIRGTTGDTGVLRYALEYASKLHGHLRVIQLDSGAPGNGIEHPLHQALAATAAPPPTQIVSRHGDPAAVLICDSVRAAALVVGTPDNDSEALSDPLLVTLRRATPCPLLEVSATGALIRATGPVGEPAGPAHASAARTGNDERRVLTVGFDGSPSSRDALAWALQHARLVEANVEVVTAIPPDGWRAAQRLHASDLQRTALRDLDPGHTVTVSTATVRGAPVDVLTRLSEHSQLIVLGRHSTQGLVHSALGAVGDACTRLASCPVVVVAGGGAPPRSATDLTAVAARPGAPVGPTEESAS